MPDDEPSRNPFVRFKQHVDANIAAGLSGVLSLPLSRAVQPPHALPSSSSPTSSSSSSGDSACPPSGPAFPGPLPSRDSRLLAWQNFLLWSDYSPLVLQDLPRQPRPRDAPADVPFTYLDAFEDLLFAASGRPMPDLRQRCDANRARLEQRRQLAVQRWNSPGFGRPVQGVRPAQLARFRVLESAGLLDAYQVEETREEWGLPSRRRRLAWAERLDNKDEDAGRDQEEACPVSQHWDIPWPSEGPEPGPKNEDAMVAAETQAVPRRDQPFEGGLFSELDRIFKKTVGTVEEEVRASPYFSRRKRCQRGESADSDAETTGNKALGTEEDIYSTVQSAVSSAERSLNAFFKSFGDIKFDGQMESSRWNGYTSMTSEDVESGPVREETSTNESVDRFGNVHVKTETRRYNAKGEEIGRETHYSIRSQSVARKEQEETEIKMEKSLEPKTWSKGDSENANAPKKSGWFWSD